MLSIQTVLTLVHTSGVIPTFTSLQNAKGPATTARPLPCQSYALPFTVRTKDLLLISRSFALIDDGLESLKCRWPKANKNSRLLLAAEEQRD